MSLQAAPHYWGIQSILSWWWPNPPPTKQMQCCIKWKQKVNTERHPLWSVSLMSEGALVSGWYITSATFYRTLFWLTSFLISVRSNHVMRTLQQLHNGTFGDAWLAFEESDAPNVTSQTENLTFQFITTYFKCSKAAEPNKVIVLLVLQHQTFKCNRCNRGTVRT